MQKHEIQENYRKHIHNIRVSTGVSTGDVSTSQALGAHQAVGLENYNNNDDDINRGPIYKISYNLS